MFKENTAGISLTVHTLAVLVLTCTQLCLQLLYTSCGHVPTEIKLEENRRCSYSQIMWLIISIKLKGKLGNQLVALTVYDAYICSNYPIDKHNSIHLHTLRCRGSTVRQFIQGYLSPCYDPLTLQSLQTVAVTTVSQFL